MCFWRARGSGCQYYFSNHFCGGKTFDRLPQSLFVHFLKEKNNLLLFIYFFVGACKSDKNHKNNYLLEILKSPVF